MQHSTIFLPPTSMNHERMMELWNWHFQSNINMKMLFYIMAVEKFKNKKYNKWLYHNFSTRYFFLSSFLHSHRIKLMLLLHKKSIKKMKFFRGLSSNFFPSASLFYVSFFMCCTAYTVLAEMKHKEMEARKQTVGKHVLWH